MTLVATQPPATGKFTAQEYLALPESSGVHMELVAGEIVVSPRPNFLHAYTLGTLFSILNDHLLANALGALYLEVDSIFDDDEVRSPDILYFPKNKSPTRESGRDMRDVPALCVEVLSPSNARTDRVDKFNLYQKHGVQDYWIVDPVEKTFEAYTLAAARYVPSARGAADQTLKAPPFPDLEIPLARLWHP